MPATIHKPARKRGKLIRTSKSTSSIKGSHKKPGSNPQKLGKAVSNKFALGKGLYGGFKGSHISKTLLNQPHQAKAVKIRGQIAKLEEELKALNFVEIPKVILPDLHDPATGRIDAQKVADFMGLPLKQLSEGLGLNYKAVHRSPSAAGFQQALRPVKRSLELLHEFFGPTEAIRAWLNTPHPDLDGASALETILEGKADTVVLILENAWSGIPV